MTTDAGRPGRGGIRYWRPLTRELDDNTSPISLFLRELTKSCRRTVRGHNEAAGSLLVPSTTANPGTIGTAFDYVIRLRFDPSPDLSLAARGASHAGANILAGLHDLAAQLGCRVPSLTDTPAGTATVTADREEELVLRAAWAIALTIEVYRTAMVWPGSPLLTIPPGKTADLLALATSDVVEELGALLALARERLFPQLMTKQSPWHFGPTFTGSHLIPADADLVAEDLLVEVKTGLGRKRPDGTRQAQLEANTIRQILGYLLLDFDNIYQITEIGYYDARYGHLSTWSATKLLQETAERDIELHDLRREFHELLRHGKL